MRVRAKHSAKLPALPSGLSTACVDPTCVLGRQVTSRLPDFHHGQTDSPLKHARDSSNTHQSYTCKCHRHPRCLLSLTDLACSAFQSGNRTSLVSGLNTPAPNPDHLCCCAGATYSQRPPILTIDVCDRSYISALSSSFNVYRYGQHSIGGRTYLFAAVAWAQWLRLFEEIQGIRELADAQYTAFTVCLWRLRILGVTVTWADDTESGPPRSVQAYRGYGSPFSAIAESVICPP